MISYHIRKKVEKMYVADVSVMTARNDNSVWINLSMRGMVNEVLH